MISPLDVPLDGGTSTDANGNYTFTTQMHPANWSVVRLVGQVAGNPRWVLLSDSSLPLDFSVGPLCAMGLLLVAPGQRLTAQIQTALAGAAVTGHFVGVMSPDLNAVLPFYVPAPNPVTVAAAPPTTVQLFDTSVVGGQPGTASFTVLAAGTTSRNFNLPLGTKALRIAAASAGAGSFTYSMVISEQGSGIVLWPQGNLSSQPAARQAPLFPARPVIVPFDAAFYLTTPLQVNLNVLGDPTSALTFWVSALFDVETVDVWSQLPLTVQDGAAPPLWQAPRVTPAAVEVSAVGTVTLLAGVAGQVIRVFGWELQIDNGGLAVAGQFTAYLEGDASLKRVGTISATGVDKSVTGYHAGAPLNSGEGLRLNGVAVGTGTVRALASVSQG